MVALSEASSGLLSPLATSYSANQGKKWTTNLIATGQDDLVPAYGYPSATFDYYENLYVAYIPSTLEGVAVAISTNFGASFTLLTNLAAADATDTPRIVAGPSTAPVRCGWCIRITASLRRLWWRKGCWPQISEPTAFLASP